MALLNCSTKGCRAHIDTQESERKDNAYRCRECGNWTVWNAPEGEIDFAALAAGSRVETRMCPHCSSKAHTVVVGLLGDHPSNVIECDCTYQVPGALVTQYREVWKDNVRVREPVQMQSYHTARRTFTVADLILRGKLIQTRPYPVDTEAGWRASRPVVKPTMARTLIGG